MTGVEGSASIVAVRLSARVTPPSATPSTETAIAARVDAPTVTDSDSAV